MMLMWTDIGLFSATLLWIALCVKICRRWLPQQALWGVAAVALGLGMLPLNGLVIGSYIFSLASWLSMPSILLLLMMITASGCGSRCARFRGFWDSSQQWLPLAVFFLFGGAVLYPMAGGLTMFDPYRLGYTGTPLSFLLPVYLLFWAFTCVVYRWYLLLLLILASVAAFYLKMLPSPNLWDYVIDPLLVIYSLCVILKCIAVKVFKFRFSN